MQRLKLKKNQPNENKINDKKPIISSSSSSSSSLSFTTNIKKNAKNNKFNNDIDEENKKKIAAMSIEDIQEQLNEIKDVIPLKYINMLKNKKPIQERKIIQIDDLKKEKKKKK